LTTGDFIGLSTSKPVTFEFTLREVATRFLQSTFGFREAMEQSIAGSAIRFSLPGNGFPCPSKVNDVAHPEPGSDR
jgi:hypothetical protein